MKKVYLAPELELIKVVQESRLLDGSEIVSATRQDYEEDPAEDWEY